MNWRGQKCEGRIFARPCTPARAAAGIGGRRKKAATAAGAGGGRNSGKEEERRLKDRGQCPCRGTRSVLGNEYALGSRDLYRAADQHDPEAVLDGVAMAGLVGVLRQLGDLAEYVRRRTLSRPLRSRHGCPCLVFVIWFGFILAFGSSRLLFPWASNGFVLGGMH